MGYSRDLARTALPQKACHLDRRPKRRDLQLSFAHTHLDKLQPVPPKPLLLLAAATLTLPTAAQTPATIYIHGNILTGAHLRPNDPDPTPARVSALAISPTGLILAIGPDAEILKLKTPTTEVIDLHNAFAMPGFNDAHTHMAATGAQQALTVNLDQTHSLAEMQSRIQTFLAAHPTSAWIQGAGWDHTLWPTKSLPSRSDLDPLTGNHPAFFFRTDGHILVSNSAALASAHITRATPDPPGGKIDRDPTRNPTGILRETPATSLLTSHVPPPTSAQRRQALLAAIADALKNGVTSVQDFSSSDDFLVLQSLEKSGDLHLRFAEWQDFNLPLATLIERRRSQPADDPLLHLTMLKAFMDGSLGSRTAALAAPYTDDPTNSGLPRYDQQELNALTSERSDAGFQLGFHAIGDQANTMALSAFAAAKSTSPNRYRIEHAQVLLPTDFDRFAQLGIIASMQPSHLLTDMSWATARLGPDRSQYAYAWRSMLDHGIPLAFGTDTPVESLNPFRGLYAATTRQNEAGTETFHPEQKLSISEAIYAYTQGSSFAEFRETTKGRLEVGYLADLIVLDRDPTTATPQQLLHTRVLRTVVNGQTVYTAPPSSTASSTSQTPSASADR